MDRSWMALCGPTRRLRKRLAGCAPGQLHSSVDQHQESSTGHQPGRREQRQPQRSLGRYWVWSLSGSARGESPGGIAPPGALRTGREPLSSSGSHHPAAGLIPIGQCANSFGSRRATRPNQCSARRRWRLNLLYFRRTQCTRAWSMCRRVGYMADL